MSRSAVGAVVSQQTKESETKESARAASGEALRRETRIREARREESRMEESRKAPPRRNGEVRTLPASGVRRERNLAKLAASKPIRSKGRSLGRLGSLDARLKLPGELDDKEARPRDAMLLRRRGAKNGERLDQPARGDKSLRYENGRSVHARQNGLLKAQSSFAPAPLCEWEVGPARAGDHPSIYQWLLAVFHAPSREEFHAEHDDPSYEPANRLLIKRGSRIISHAQISKRMMNFGPLQLPVSQLSWLGTLPEFRGQGAASQLLAAVDERMHRDGSMLGLLRTRSPRFFHRAGWAVCGRHCLSRGGAHDILARYWAQPELRRQPLNIRLWRHFELAALMRIYAQNTGQSFGPLGRDEAYWRWLISRGAFDHIVIALAGPDRLDINESAAPIVGYAVVRQKRIVELLRNEAYPTADAQILARACSDAIERRGSEIVLEAPASDPLHEFIRSAGGTLHHHESVDGEVMMAKVLDPVRFMEKLSPLIEARYRSAIERCKALEKGCELGVLAGDERFSIECNRRGVRVARGRIGRGYIACTSAESTRLLLGHCSAREAAEQGRLTSSTQSALEIATALFPRLPTWRPTWDDLPA
ncbi:MAG TPA: GNAT family N-acetyltransferase [Pirellulales bacterium]|nr:GNAT family N-acetyltransferase [Pirellulales bacterium]